MSRPEHAHCVIATRRQPQHPPPPAAAFPGRNPRSGSCLAPPPFLSPLARGWAEERQILGGRAVRVSVKHPGATGGLFA
ncbi:Hypothetical predicted protein [Podarcis lilfordi]|uniref:Uncharacterized protein n=1 Tax=Podarcis lilfordi TaxID=74358 RepID=A0AA35PGR1_9SAUR|nr:Hypothetical predicted protein [Podarcis lilfordi]